jgi:hypothetical protein
MTNDDLEAHFQSLGWQVEILQAPNGNNYIVVRNYVVPTGTKAGSVIDLAIERTGAVPYIMPSAIHTSSALIPTGNNSTSASPLGSGWQYWSRTLLGQATPQRIVAHIATVFSEI